MVRHVDAAVVRRYIISRHHNCWHLHLVLLRIESAPTAVRVQRARELRRAQRNWCDIKRKHVLLG